jgi:hypothetical protein
VKVFAADGAIARARNEITEMIFMVLDFCFNILSVSMSVKKGNEKK